jgi:hypothetical protein
LRIPAGEYFVLGDNRNDSEDSRYWGLVPRANLVGRPLVVYFALRPGADGGREGVLSRLHGVLRYGLSSARILR